VVECTGLENRNTRKGIVGSNPTLSATVYDVWHGPGAYRGRVSRPAKPEGHVIVAAFGPHGPTKVQWPSLG
jgi:hypothetical protein